MFDKLIKLSRCYTYYNTITFYTIAVDNIIKTFIIYKTKIDLYIESCTNKGLAHEKNTR